MTELSALNCGMTRLVLMPDHVVVMDINVGTMCRKNEEGVLLSMKSSFKNAS